jgi:hypothetical protein
MHILCSGGLFFYYLSSVGCMRIRPLGGGVVDYASRAVLWQRMPT